MPVGATFGVGTVRGQRFVSFVASETRTWIESKSTEEVKNRTMDHEACCFDSWDYLNERCDVASDWNDIGCYVQGGEACDLSLDFPIVNETRM